MLDITSLSHKYATDYALRSVSLTIQDTGIIGLLGSNGAGKSTLMNIVCGCLSPTRGAVRVDGFDVLKKPLEVRSRIGFLPQQAPLSLELTVREYLTFCGGLRNIAPRQLSGAVDEAMARCGLISMQHRLINNLSGGYRQRVGIAQAIIHQPKLVILDEPTVGLDPNQIQGVRQLIEEIGAERTVVFSTHILPEVEMLCRDVVMIEGGEIVFDGNMKGFRQVVTPTSLILTCAQSPDPGGLKGVVTGITAVESLSDHKLRIRFEEGADIVPALLDLAQSQHWGLQEIYFEASNLEDVFAHLSQKEAA